MPFCFRFVFLFLFISSGLSAQPNAVFTFTNACEGHPLHFTDHSTEEASDTIVSRNWNFGDAGTSTLLNPTHTYSSYGVYEVRLIVTTVLGVRDTVIHMVESYAVPEVSMSANPFTGCQSLTVNFTNTTTIDTGSIASWLWDFDDGTTSTLQNPVHTFDVLFGHTVKLTATSNKGCADSVTREIFVLQNPVCDFTASLVSLNDSSPIVNFTNLSSGGNIDLLWDFGDGDTSTEYSLLHTYDTCGTYNVILTATGTNTCVTVADYLLVVCDDLVQIYNGVEDAYSSKMDDDIEINIFPNPSYGEGVAVSYELKEEGNVSCFILDIAGRRVAMPFDKNKMQAGKHSFEVKEELPAGIYFLMLEVSGSISSRKLIITDK